MAEPGRGRYATVARVAGGAGAGVGGDDPRGRDFPDLLVRAVADVEVPVRGDLDPARRVEARRRRGPAVARRSGQADAGDGRDDPGGRGNLPDHVVPRIGDVDVAVGS